MSTDEFAAFRHTVLDYYRVSGRSGLPWRLPEADGSFSPYKILVSEIMLQQTQVGRVIPKYLEFTSRYPDVTALANAPLGDVLRLWSGLGYNRRAKYLCLAARLIIADFNGQFPSDIASLTRLPGVGKNTAGAIIAYAYNQPAVFIETNIRTVYLHHFFAGQTSVADKTILELVRATLPESNVREWYWALMDYGSYLKQTVGNLNNLGSGYSKQSAFAGSKRQLRGQVIRLLGERYYTPSELAVLVADNRLAAVLDELVSEALITKTGGRYHL